MWSKFVPVAVALAVGLQGCILEVFANLPMAAKVAVGKACHDAAAKVGDKEGLKEIAGGDCGSVDENKLKDLGVEDCATAMHKWLGNVLTLECEARGAEAIAEDCEEVSSGCKDKLDSTLKTWVPESLPKKDAEVEHKKGVEVVVAIFAACAKMSRTFVDEEKENVAALCTSKADAKDFQTMGVSVEDCPVYVHDELVSMHSSFCMLHIVLNTGLPDGMDKKLVDDSAEAYFKELQKDTEDNMFDAADENADRLRLFQTTMKSRTWLGRKSSLSKVAVFGGATLIALTALVAVGVRRRSTIEPVAEEQEMLEGVE